MGRSGVVRVNGRAPDPDPEAQGPGVEQRWRHMLRVPKDHLGEITVDD